MTPLTWKLRRQALAPLAALCREEAAHASAALALVTLVLRRHLPASQWLPVMQQARPALLRLTCKRELEARPGHSMCGTHTEWHPQASSLRRCQWPKTACGP